jgi:hypothetical protein
MLQNETRPDLCHPPHRPHGEFFGKIPKNGLGIACLLRSNAPPLEAALGYAPGAAFLA